MDLEVCGTEWGWGWDSRLGSTTLLIPSSLSWLKDLRGGSNTNLLSLLLRVRVERGTVIRLTLAKLWHVENRLLFNDERRLGEELNGGNIRFDIQLGLNFICCLGLGRVGEGRVLVVFITIQFLWLIYDSRVRVR